MRIVNVLVFAALLLPSMALANATPEWIWLNETKDNQRAYFRLAFEVEGDIASATLAATCDDEFTAYVNGERRLKHGSWNSIVTAPLKTALKQGENVLAIEAKNGGSRAGLVCSLSITYSDGKEVTFVSNGDWQSNDKKKGDLWRMPGFKGKGWPKAKSLGALGSDALPWTERITVATLEESLSFMADPTPVAEAIDDLELLPGFKAELIYSVPKGQQGSWVAMANAPDGGLFVSDQGEAGIFHVMPATIGDAESETVVSSVPAQISGAHGLFYAFDGLYAHKSEGNRKGLYKATDSTGDGKLDKVDFLTKIDGGGEHGPHAIIYTEDKQDLYIVAGNHTNLPETTGSRLPDNWSEDLLLPRQWDARGHAKGKLAPGGWVCKVTPDGSSWEVVSNGYRNQYDVAMNPAGEMFTYDADMEWDMGMPWYRPTRVCHVVSGSEFGWRSGTGKWPSYYEDSLPPVIDIGPGSPTGVVFGTGANFPAKYQQALYILDWTFGTIYAIHMKPEGASYKAVKEEFISGSPLAVTDTVIGSDGAFYFTVGGRGTQSALYRVYYAGDDGVAPAEPKESKSTIEARALRRSLEAFHNNVDDAAVKTAWKHLDSKDRFIRYAARVAIESQPVENWQEQALAERDATTSAVAMIALARQGDSAVQGELLEALGRINLARVDETTQLIALRAYALSFIRMGRPDQATIDTIVEKLDPLLPAKSDDVNTELVRLMVYLDAPSIVEKGMALLTEAKAVKVPDWAELISRNQGYGGTIMKMLENHPPSQKINYALMLRNVRYGWSMDQREAYFTFINEAAKHTGGASYGGFLTNIRNEALANCSDAEKVALAPLTGESLEALPEFEITPPVGADEPWTLKSALAAVKAKGLSGRDFKQGRNGYHAVGCAACHRFDGTGGAVGPDLSSVGSKFSVADLLEAIIEPNNVISDQYGMSIVRLNDGGAVMGIVVNNSGSEEEGSMEVYTTDPNAEPIIVKTADVKAIQPSPLSQMPEGLADALNEDELLDLLAYLMSRGNPEANYFKK